MKPERIITITNPGYEVVLFMANDGSAEAVITGTPKMPTRVGIVAPAPGRRIVVTRRGGVIEVEYQDVA